MAKKRVETRLCTSVGAGSVGQLARKATLALSLGTDLVELRIDKLTGDPSGDLETKLSSLSERAIITVRSRREGGSFSGSEAERLELISRLAKMGPAFVDIELATAKENRIWVEAMPRRVRRIVSWHDFEGTPDLARLRTVSKEALGHGSIAKVVTTATSVDDNTRTLALCEEKPGKVISFCMGELGTVSRVTSMRLGAPIAYASLPGEAVAPGQLSISTMQTLRRMVT